MTRTPWELNQQGASAAPTMLGREPGREPAAAFEQEEPVWCDLHQRRDCTLCDECGHEGALHLNGHELREAGQLAQAGYAFANATCWAENVCSACSPARYAAALELAR